MYKSVIQVKPLSNYMLQLTFEDNSVRKFDVKPYLNIGVFSELKDISLFNSVHIAFDTVEWANGIDLDPEVLYKESSSVPSQPIA